jgi:hypothetical protein
MTALGGEIGYFSGDPLRLLEDAQILRPNYFPSVPRVLNRIYQSAMLAGQAPGMKGYLFRTALDTKLRRLKDTGNNKHVLWDRLVFSKVCSMQVAEAPYLRCPPLGPSRSRRTYQADDLWVCSNQCRRDGLPQGCVLLRRHRRYDQCSASCTVLFRMLIHRHNSFPPLSFGGVYLLHRITSHQGYVFGAISSVNCLQYSNDIITFYQLRYDRELRHMHPCLARRSLRQWYRRRATAV